MKHYLLVGAMAVALAGCVQPPEARNSAPTLKLAADITKTYPGSNFRISVDEVSDAEDNDTVSISWAASIDGVSVVESTNDFGEFSIDLSVAPNQTFKVTATADDGKGGKTTQSVDLSVVPEPFVILDAETTVFNSSESHPIYLTGVYSAKAVNLKSADTLDSDNYIIDVSPNGQFVFYTQLMANADWVARLYDAATNLNHTVNMSFTDIDELAVETFWSNDSNYLAIKMPNELDSDNDALLWFSTKNLTSLTAIEPSVATLNFETLVWSDNDVDAGEPPYAAIGKKEVSRDATTTLGSMKVFDPASETPLTELLVGTGADPLTLVTGASTQWTNNQMFFIGSTTQALTGHITNLYRWKPSTGLTEKVNGASTNVTKFTAYKATQIVYTAKNSGTAALYYFNGVEESVVTSGSSSSATSLDYDWSPNGRLLGIHVSTFFSSWEPRNGAVVHLPVTNATNIIVWNWDKDYGSVSLLNPTVANVENTLYTATTTDPDSAIVAAANLKRMSTAGTNVPASIFNTLQRSPDGTWQLFWALKTDASDEHIDLWAYNTVTQETANLSRLKEMYEAPVSEGIFTTKAGFNDSDDLKWVNTDIVWLNNSELLFKVMSIDDAAVTTPEIVDVRMVSLDTLAMPRSIILNPETKTELTRVVSQ
ncbi:hypothetical protein [Reinekea sp. G2M2-21]|uniref:hypothetical protein n=1 Tax=Reinekea sp. G2M2-21 TaxID=2788942 RepID=UPI0018A9344F|nr:hypothetical protein [Reinekea sp. G2M2-21]